MKDKPRRNTSENPVASDRPGIAPPDAVDPVIELYKKDVDRGLLRENLRLTVEERLSKLQSFVESLEEVRASGKKLKEDRTTPV